MLTVVYDLFQDDIDFLNVSSAVTIGFWLTKRKSGLPLSLSIKNGNRKR